MDPSEKSRSMAIRSTVHRLTDTGTGRLAPLLDRLAANVDSEASVDGPKGTP